MDLGLHDVVALVVGGTGLIGGAVACALYDEGATVVLGARSPDRLGEVAASIGSEGGREVDTVVLDTADQDSVDAAVAEVVERHGGIGVLVNTAAPPAQTIDPDHDTDPAQILGAVDGKAMGYLRVTTAVLPLMTEAGYGRIVQVSGQNVYLTASVTATTRNAAVTIATKTLADRAVGTGVTLNVVNPGAVTDTPSDAVKPAMAGDSTPAQVADLVVFLCSGSAGAISGESVAVGHRVRGVLGY